MFEDGIFNDDWQKVAESMMYLIYVSVVFQWQYSHKKSVNKFPNSVNNHRSVCRTEPFKRHLL